VISQNNLLPLDALAVSLINRLDGRIKPVLRGLKIAIDLERNS
jgi:hypothetical protein